MNTEEKKRCRQDSAACFAYKDGCCVALKDTNFGDRKCPFFKVHTQAQEEDILRRQRLLAMGLKPREIRGDGD